MIVVRFLLFPLAIVYGWITGLRNFLYDKGILQSTSFSVPIVAVGNLSVGGTGKTPQTEYLLKLLLPRYKVAVLSRGYKRKSTGFFMADANSTIRDLGDEPFQMHQKFPEAALAVDANRVNGINRLLESQHPEVILLDDAFQHRKVKAGFYILLTAYGDLYADDYLLPTGNLREGRKGARRANVIIVTKCPNNLSEIAKQEIKEKLKATCPVFFSTIAYGDSVIGKEQRLPLAEVQKKSKLVLAGIAKPKFFFDYVKNENDEQMTFPDHHHFSEQDIRAITTKGKNKLILTTEKDYVRLAESYSDANLFYLPIESKFISEQQEFDSIILNYVGQSTRNS